MSRLAELKQRLVKEREAQEKPFPLLALLQLYHTGHHRLYLNYFEDFKLLRDWLGPIDIPLQPQLPSLPLKQIPPLFHTYEIQELAKHINCHPYIIYKVYLQWILDCDNFHTVADLHCIAARENTNYIN